MQAAAPVGDEVEPNRLLVVEHPVDQLPRLAEDLGSIALAAGLHRFTANHVQGWGGETLAALRLVKH